MTIQRSFVGTQAISQNTEITIELLQSPPNTAEYLNVPVSPHTLVGFYNDVLDAVELYVTDGTGRRYIKVQ